MAMCRSGIGLKLARSTGDGQRRPGYNTRDAALAQPGNSASPPPPPSSRPARSCCPRRWRRRPGRRRRARDWRGRSSRPPQSSLVYARDGSLIGEIGSEWRTSVSIRTLPKYVGEAFIAVEDKRFYQHNGVDVVGIAGAIKDNLLGASRGASTITQLLVGNMHPDLVDRRDKSLSRKLHEQSAAREMERHYNKEQILEAFLNQINFGHGWYGVETASRHYFGKPASQLTIAEAATLAALPKGPAIYDPVKYPDRAKNRRDAILGLMAEQKYITPAEAAAAQVGAGAHRAGRRRLRAVAVLHRRRARAGRTRGRAGLAGRIPHLHHARPRAAARRRAGAGRRGRRGRSGVPAIAIRPCASHPKGSTDYLQGAVVAIDPSSGDVKALVGGRNYQESPFNRAVSGLRQPGSSFKPFVYARALMDSLPPNAIVGDTAIDVRYDEQTYQPRNCRRQVHGEHHAARGDHLLAKPRRRPALDEVRPRLDHRARPPVRHRHAHRAVSRQRDRRVGSAAARFRRGLHGVRQPRHADGAAVRLSRRGPRGQDALEPGRARRSRRRSTRGSRSSCAT